MVPAALVQSMIFCASFPKRKFPWSRRLRWPEPKENAASDIFRSLLFAVSQSRRPGKEELQEAELLQIGRLLARLHTVGAAPCSGSSAAYTSRIFARFAESLQTGLVDMQLQSRYERAARTLFRMAEPLWQD